MKKEYIYVGICILLWSTSATVTKLLLSSFNSMQILAISSFIAFAFLLIYNLIKGKLKELKKYMLKDYLHLAGIGFLGTFLYKLFLYLGMNEMMASQAYILNYLWPIMTVIFACIILKEKLTLRKIVAIILSFIGVIIVTTNGNFGEIEKSSIIGAIYCILAAISCGLFSVFTKFKQCDKYISVMIYNLVSFIISMIYILICRDWFTLDVPQFIGFLWIGIFTVGLAYALWMLALEKGDTAKISNLSYISPFLSLIWTSLILKEKITIYSIIGLVIIVSGIFIQLKESNKKKGLKLRDGH